MTNFRNVFKCLVAIPFTFGLINAVWAQEVIKIGYTGPLSGGGALYGKNVASGVELAINEINLKNPEVAGKKVKFELVALDDKYSPAEAAINARRLVQQDKAAVIFIPHTGGVYALQAFNERENFMIMGYTSVPQITEVGNKLTVRPVPSFNVFVGPFANHQFKKYGKSVGLLPGDHEYAKLWTEAFTAKWEKLPGATITSRNPMSYNKSADFYSGVSKVLATKPNLLFVGGPSEPTALVIKQSRELGFKGGFILMEQCKLDEMAIVLGGYSALEGSMGVLPIKMDDRIGAKAFSTKYLKAYGPDRPPTQESSYNYTFMHAVALAMQLSGSTTDALAIRAKMNEAVSKIPKDLNSGSFTAVDQAGNSDSEVFIGLVENGVINKLTVAEANK
jgi:branched-chain amino acid transport system substrate-binding protein